MFFFVKQKTAYEMRISDWSSDVCSSDLVCDVKRCPLPSSSLRRIWWFSIMPLWTSATRSLAWGCALASLGEPWVAQRVWPMPDRKSVGEGKSVSVRVDLGGGRYMKHTNTITTKL